MTRKDFYKLSRNARKISRLIELAVWALSSLGDNGERKRT